MRQQAGRLGGKQAEVVRYEFAAAGVEFFQPRQLAKTDPGVDIGQIELAAVERHVAAAEGPLVLVAHSLGCVTLAHWAVQAAPALLAKVRGALLVAPADVERPGCPQALRNFAPIPRQRLPFPSLLVGSDNDPAATPMRALQLARQWGAEPVLLGGAGHINVKSGHCRWEQGFAYLYRLQNLIEQHARRLA